MVTDGNPRVTEPAAFAPYARFRETATFGSLDGLRALSILPVVWHHATPRPLEGILGKGPLGVDLFFTISGFLITTLLLRERDRTPAARISVRDFYRRRVLRIFPLYYTILALYVVRAIAWPPAPALRAHFFASLPFFATFTTNWFVDFTVPHPVVFAFSWSLATEEQFYALWPWLFRGRWLPLIAAISLLLVDQLAERGALAFLFAEGSTTLRMLKSIASPICLGAIAACLAHEKRAFRLLHVVAGHRASAPFSFALLVAAIALPHVSLFTTHVVLALLVLACTVREDNGLAPFLRARPMVSLGAVSYGVYMVHVAVIAGLRPLLPGTERMLPLFAAALALSYAAARISYRFLETPFLRMRSRHHSAASPAKR
ncbi:MAG: acyltransferase [Polyangiaceae bacterium]